MNRLTYIIPIILIVFTSYLSAESQFRGYSKLTSRLQVQKSSFELGEPIIVQFKIINKDYSPVSIMLSEKPYNNFSFSIKSIKNQMVNEQEYFNREKIDAKRDIKIIKKISLSNEQFYGERFDLTRYYKLEKPGHYIIQGFFTPTPKNIQPGIQIKSQVIQIEIRESPYQELITLKEQIREDIELKKIRNPYETIQFMLNARRKRKWNRYFSYIDLHMLIKEYPKHNKKYNAQQNFRSNIRDNQYRELTQRYESLKPSKRESIIEEFKEYLKDYLSDIGYNRLDRFIIYKSVVENEKKKAKIFTKIYYKGEGITYYRKYVFYLYQKNRRWYVYSWKVENL